MHQRIGPSGFFGFSREAFVLELGADSWSQNILLFFHLYADGRTT